MALTAEEKQARDKAWAEKYLGGTRPGVGQGRPAREDIKPIAVRGVKLTPIEYVAPRVLEPNERNPYPALQPSELAELAADVKAKGVLVPCIAHPDGTLICGHNRREAAITAGLEAIPVQYVEKPSPVPEALEREIMKSENERRRGSAWSTAQQRAFILEHFGDRIAEDRRGGDRKSEAAKNQNGHGDFDPETTLAEEIATASRDKITLAAAKKRAAELRREAKKAEQARTASETSPEVIKTKIARLESQASEHERQAKELRKQAKELRKSLGNRKASKKGSKKTQKGSKKESKAERTGKAIAQIIKGGPARRGRKP